jgi:hypothetical protein
MKLMQRLFIVLVCAAAAACATGQAKEAEAGFVAAANGTAYLYTTDGHLSAATPIQLQYPAGKSAAQCCLRLQGSALEAPSGSTGPVTDALFGQPVFRYRLKQTPAALKGDPFVGAAVIGPAAASTKGASAGTVLQLATTSAVHSQQMQTCLGSEGSNLFLIEGGKLQSQLYYAFGYDVTATCDPKLFDLPTAQ